ncbi:ABC transporter permease [Halorussus caseinilyticus]|uniref:ABC transporter permease n=1 Tax=Halorussus caseinilyticus TaxID=3034025 RepID=A0ABD5WR22_9EURY
MATETDGAVDTGTLGAIFGDEQKEKILKYSLYAIAGALLVFLWIPLVVMVVLSFAVNASTFFPFRGFTLAHYTATFADEALMSALWNSVQIATISATIATILGVLAASRWRATTSPTRKCTAPSVSCRW